MDENKKIGYRPDLKYTDEYTSDIQYHRDNQDDSNNNQDDINNLIDDLLEQGQDLQNLVDKLPDFIGDIIKDHLDPIIDFVEDELKDKKLEKVPTLLEWTYKPYEPDPKPKPDDNDDNKPVDDPEYDIWNPTDDIVIEKKRYEYSEIIQKEYIKNIYDLMSEYYSELQNILSNFWSILLYSIMNKESNEIKVILDNIILNSSEVNDSKKHLLDLSVKSEINRDMKLKYFSNNFDAEGSMVHLKQFKAVYELRLRYAKINKDTKLKHRAYQMSNNILESMNITYSQKYDKSYENLYRYLKSSNAVLKDSLDSASQSIRAKQTLIDTKGVK